MRPQRELNYDLLCTPTPFPREAMSSWMARVCTMHHCSLRQLRATSRLKAAEDSDFDWPYAHEVSARSMAVSADELSHMTEWKRSFIAAYWPRYLVLGRAGSPSAAACFACIRERGAVWYSVENRFAFMTRCLVHGEPIRLLSSDLLQDEERRRQLLWNIESEVPTKEPGTIGLQGGVLPAMQVRLCRLLRLGYERHARFGVVSALTILNSWAVRKWVAESFRRQAQEAYEEPNFAGAPIGDALLA